MMYRRCSGNIEVLLVHPGGPFWKNKDDGSWTFPRGEVRDGEELLAAAEREFSEETGLSPTPPHQELGETRHKSGKIVHAWAFEGDCDPPTLRSNTFKIEWPPKSGKLAEFPEIDRAEFFSLEAARAKVFAVETVFLDRLSALIAGPSEDLL
jgi:predicted NUDIX family NTP pyrophosphohydrolase